VLKHDADDPARLLSDRMLQVSGEMLAYTDDLGEFPVHAERPRLFQRQFRIADGIAGEDAFHAFLLEAETDVVVLGETLHVEGNTVAVFEQRTDGLAAEASADASAGHLTCQGFADDNVLAMVFGKFVNVVPGGEAMPFWCVRVNRNLNQVFVRQQIVEQAQLHRRNHVLGIVQDEPGKLDFRLAFKTQDRVDDVVQTVGLTGRAGAGAHHFMYVGIVLADRVDVRLRVRVVGIGADENLIILVVDGRGCQPRHFTDHADFIPRWHHDRQWFFSDGVQALLIGPFELFIDPPAPDQLSAPVHKVDEQIIETEQEHQQGEGNRHIFKAEQHIRKKIDPPQTHAPTPERALSQAWRRVAISSLAWPSP